MVEIAASTKASSSRNLNIELLRVVAVFSIVFYHYFITMLSLSSSQYLFLEALAQTAMIAFFSISGFGLYLYFEKGKRTYFQFLKHRLTHLLPQYYLNILFVVFTTGTVYFSAWGYKIVLSNFLCIQNLNLQWQGLNGVTWTVALMVQFYLVSPLIYHLMRRNSFFIFLFIVIAMVCRYISGAIVTHLEVDAVYYVVCNIRQLPMTIDIFALGMLAAKLSNSAKHYLHRFSNLSHPLSIVAFSVIFLAIVICHNFCISKFNGMWDPTTSPVLWVISWETILGIAISGLIVVLRYSNTVPLTGGGLIIQGHPGFICMQHECLLLPHGLTRQSNEKRVDFLSMQQLSDTFHISNCNHRHSVCNVYLTI